MQRVHRINRDIGHHVRPHTPDFSRCCTNQQLRNTHSIDEPVNSVLSRGDDIAQKSRFVWLLVPVASRFIQDAAVATGGK